MVVPADGATLPGPAKRCLKLLGESNRLEDTNGDRQLGRSGLRVSVLTLGTMASRAGSSKTLGRSISAGVRRQIDMALDAA